MAVLHKFLLFALLFCVPFAVIAADTNVSSSTDPDTCYYELTLSYFEGYPDGVRKVIMGINNQFPGPTLRCMKGQWMHIRVHNQLDEPSSIHWHGIEQNLSPFYDGPEMVSQCPIAPGSSMDYIFELDQSGTYWYHSHHSYQYIDGVWGLLIVDNPREVWADAYTPGDELIFALNDWHHTPGRILSKNWLNRYPPGSGIPVPDSGLINGRGRASPCFPPACNPDFTFPSVQQVKYCRTYRVRIINTSARSNFNFSIPGYKLDVIEVDGVDTERVGPVDVITVWPAQRYSALITIRDECDWTPGCNPCDGAICPPGFVCANACTNCGPCRLPATFIEVRGAMSTISHTALALLELDRRSECVKTPVIGPMSMSMDDGVQGRPSSHPAPTVAKMDRQQRIREIIRIAKRVPENSISVSGSEPSAATKAAVAQYLTSGANFQPGVATLTPTLPLVYLDPSACVPKLSRGDPGPPVYFDVEFVLNQTNCDNATKYENRSMCINDSPYHIGSRPVLLQTLKGERVPESANPFYIPTFNTVVQLVINNGLGGSGHPWHLHGHTFWVLGTGAAGEGPYNATKHASKLNVTHAVRRDTTHAYPDSWVVVRFIADNPGAWLFHCHINWHLEAGLGAVFVENERRLQQMYRVPEDWLDVCRTSGIQV